MGRYLIVANQTVGGTELDQRIQDRIDHGQGRFYVVVPMTAPDYEVTPWSSGEVALGVPVSTNVTDEAMDRARKQSQQRLDAMIAKIESLGGEAEGEVGATDPMVAVKTVLKGESFDEVIVSTLPVGMSRWARMDLSSRVGRITNCPVSTVEAEASS